MEIRIRTNRSKLAEGRAHDVDVLVTLRAPPAAQAVRRALCLMTVVDVSGSMRGQKLASVQAALRQLARHLLPGDRLGLVTFGTDVRALMPLTEVTETARATFLQRVSTLLADQRTNIAGGLLEGVRQAGAHQTRIILLTDGLANEGQATTRDRLVALVRAQPRGVSVSAFGYGADCDHVVLGEMAEAGGGSYAFIEKDEQVLAAFARELGGLVSTYAADVELENERLGDLLYGGELAWFGQIAVAPAAGGEGVEIASLRLRYRDELGREMTAVAPVLVDVVAPERASREDDPEVLRARYQDRLRRAQQKAEEHARRGEWTEAHAAIADVAALTGDAALREFAQELSSLYSDEEEYSTSSGARSTALSALKRKRQLLRSKKLDALFATATSDVEKDFEDSFTDST